MKTHVHFCSYLAQFFLEWEMLQAEVLEKTKTRHVQYFYFTKIMPFMRWGKNIVNSGRPQVTVWRMRIVCWISKATDTHLEYVVLIASPPQ